MSKSLAIGCTTLGTSLGSSTGCIRPGVSKSLAIGCITYRTGLGISTSCIRPAVSKSLAIGCATLGTSLGSSTCCSCPIVTRSLGFNSLSLSSEDFISEDCCVGSRTLIFTCRRNHFAESNRSGLCYFFFALGTLNSTCTSHCFEVLNIPFIGCIRPIVLATSLCISCNAIQTNLTVRKLYFICVFSAIQCYSNNFVTNSSRTTNRFCQRCCIIRCITNKLYLCHSGEGNDYFGRFIETRGIRKITNVRSRAAFFISKSKCSAHPYLQGGGIFSTLILSAKVNSSTYCFLSAASRANTINKVMFKSRDNLGICITTDRTIMSYRTFFSTSRIGCCRSVIMLTNLVCCYPTVLHLRSGIKSTDHTVNCDLITGYRLCFHSIVSNRTVFAIETVNNDAIAIFIFNVYVTVCQSIVAIVFGNSTCNVVLFTCIATACVKCTKCKSLLNGKNRICCGRNYTFANIALIIVIAIVMLTSSRSSGFSYRLATSITSLGYNTINTATKFCSSFSCSVLMCTNFAFCYCFYNESNTVNHCTVATGDCKTNCLCGCGVNSNFIVCTIIRLVAKYMSSSINFYSCSFCLVGSNENFYTGYIIRNSKAERTCLT